MPLAVADTRQQETIGQRLKRLREDKGLSQREISGPGASYGYVSKVENDIRKPTKKALRVFAERLGVSAHYLETGELIPAAVEREIQLSDAELELRLHGDLGKAREVFSGVVDEDEEPSLLARARAGLGLLAAHEGNNVGAIRHLTAAVESGYMPPEVRPDVYETLGTAQSATGLNAAAAELFQGCLEALRRSPREDEEEATRVASLEIRFTAYLANALSEIGATDRARDVLNTALTITDASPAARVFLLWTRARLAWMKSEGYAALDYIKTAIGLLDASEDRLQLARAHLACAQLTNLDARPAEAARHLAEAEELLRQGADATDLGVMRAEQAKVAAMEGRADDTMSLAREADELLSDDVRYSGLAAHVLGIAFAVMGDIDQASPHFQRALDDLEERRQWREAADVARSFARHLRAVGRAAEASDVMDRAAVLGARQMGSERRRAQAREQHEGRRSRA
jgi:transcriptional regulator with XRE-family HTH domain